MKETLIIYRDWWEAMRNLPPELRFKAFDSICEYAFEGKQPEDPIIRAVTALMRSAIDRDRAKYEEICNKRRISGRLGGAPKGNRNASKTTQNNQNQPKQANGFLNNQNQPKQPDNDNEYEYDNNPSNEGDIKGTPTQEEVIEKFVSENQITIEGFCKSNEINPQIFRSLMGEVLNEWSFDKYTGAYIPKGNGTFEARHLLNEIRVKNKKKNEHGTTNRNNGSAETYEERNRKFQEHIIQKLNTPHQEQDISGNY